MGESKKKPDELEKVGLKTVLDGANQRYKKLAEHAGELFGDEYSKVELLYDTFATELKGTRPDAGDLALLREFYPKK
jgi:hypothetical protein